MCQWDWLLTEQTCGVKTKWLLTCEWNYWLFFNSWVFHLSLISFGPGWPGETWVVCLQRGKSAGTNNRKVPSKFNSAEYAGRRTHTNSQQESPLTGDPSKHIEGSCSLSGQIHHTPESQRSVRKKLRWKWMQVERGAMKVLFTLSLSELRTSFNNCCFSPKFVLSRRFLC